jgi:hypothetical protein
MAKYCVEFGIENRAELYTIIAPRAWRVSYPQVMTRETTLSTGRAIALAIMVRRQKA